MPSASYAVNEALRGDRSIDLDAAARLTPAQKAIIDKCDAVQNLLLEKNRAYGNSALEPQGIMAQGDAVDLIAVRIDDKLSRIKNAGGLLQAMGQRETEDTVQDLIGYLILAQVAYEWNDEV